MKRVNKILLLLLLLTISCRNKNDYKGKTTFDDKKIDFADTSRIGKKGPDNYLIDYTSKQDSGPVYMYCESMPEFPGGETAFIDYLKRKIKYPQPAVSDKKEGRVVVKFIVRANGEIRDVQIIRTVRPDMDRECMRVISEMPEWKPGMISNKPVAVSYNIPIRFLLKKSENLNGIFILPSKNPSSPPAPR